jgi:hypothetical protein
MHSQVIAPMVRLILTPIPEITEPAARQEGTGRTMTFSKENSEKARLANAFGRARQRETRERNILECEQITAQLLSGLGRAPVGGETVAAETIAATLVAGRRLRERGRSDEAERQLLRRMLAISPFGLTPQAPPAHLDPSPAGTYCIVEKGVDE